MILTLKIKQLLYNGAKNHKTRIVHLDLKITILLYLHCRKLNEGDLLFNFSSVYVSYEFLRIMRKSDIKKITLHDIRHIYASFLLSKLNNSANSLLFVSRQLRSFFINHNTYYIFTYYEF